MPQTAPNTAVRRMSYAGLAFAALNLGFGLLATRQGGLLRWLAIGIPLLMTANSLVGLQIGPFRNARAQLWYCWISIVVAVGLTVSVVVNFLGILQ